MGLLNTSLHCDEGQGLAAADVGPVVAEAHLADGPLPTEAAHARAEAGVEGAALVAGPARAAGPLPLRAAVGDGLLSESGSGSTG